MKKILSLFTLIVFFFIGFAHNPITVFAIENILCCSNEIKIGSIEVLETNNNQGCAYGCCNEKTTNHGVVSFASVLQKKVFKSISMLVDKNIVFVKPYLLNNKNLVSKTSPPYFDRKISNYSYHTLIKIIKSNT